ncbi:MAG: 30S ribosomal protein S20 [Candidatus Hydrogenedens sp.]
MANIKSQKKRIITNEKRRMKNASIRSAMKTMIKKAYQSLNADDKNLREMAIKKAIQIIDRACSKGVIHKNSAARRKSRLMKRVNKAIL